MAAAGGCMVDERPSAEGRGEETYAAADGVPSGRKRKGIWWAALWAAPHRLRTGELEKTMQ